MFCERCGQQFLPHESVCTRCREAPTRQWLQLIGLAMLAITVVFNSFSAATLFPRLAASGAQSWQFHVWFQLDDLFSEYGWIAAAVAVLVWSFWGRRGYQLRKREWLARVLLILLLLVAGIGALPLPKKFLGRAAEIRSTLQNSPGLGPTLAWVPIVLVVGILCLNNETRDSLLGHGRVLSLVSLCLLCLMLALATMGWSTIHH